ncbi:WG repeat-containing protein [Feifania hominis]|uniref:WG repeat-containing protein n=1 Tax=Feifania hominis TaxID=2763660 RepID=UPI002015ED84
MICLLAAALLLSCVGCTGQPANDSPDETPTTAFHLTRLPDLEPYEGVREISSRYYEEYTDHLIPRDDYGELYPYAGKIIGEGTWEVQAIYGLCDAQGRIVVDPVYRSVHVREDSEGNRIISASLLMDEENATESDYTELTVVIDGQGRWSLGPQAGYLGYFGNGKFAFCRSAWEDDLYLTYSTLYSLEDAQPLFPEIQGYLDYAMDEFYVVSGPVDEENYGYRFYREDGTPVESPAFRSIGSLEQGRATVMLREGQWGILDENFNWVVEPQYQYIQSNGAGLYTVQTQTGYGVIDADGREILPAEYDYVSFWNGDTTVSVCKNGVYSLFDTVSNTFLELPNHSQAASSTGGNVFYQRINDGIDVFTSEGQFHIDGGEYVSYCGEQLPLIVTMISSATDEGYTQDVMLVDRQGNQVGPLFHDCYAYVLNDAILVSDTGSGRTGLIDAEGNFLISQNYRSIRDLGNGYFDVQGALYSGIVDLEENWIIRIPTTTLD